MQSGNGDPVVKRPRPKSAAQKFTSLFDKKWETKKSNVRCQSAGNGRKKTTYDVTYSWDGKTDNPEEFSRLQAVEMPVQNMRPVTMSGHRVVPLEHESAGFEVLNVYPQKTAEIPLTYDQREVGMMPGLSGKIPILEQALSSNKVVIEESHSTFKNHKNEAPTFKVVNVPNNYKEAGPSWDQKLLNPRERRELLEFERSKEKAERFIFESISQRKKTREQMLTERFKRGVVGVDHNDNVLSEVYGETAKKNKEDRDLKHTLGLERKCRLGVRTSSIVTNGNILVPQSLDGRVKVEPFFQTKKMEHTGFNVLETHNRLFFRPSQKENFPRRQNIRDVESSGKQYHIVTHALVENWPARHFERKSGDRLTDKALLHPSQTSLEDPRNTLGATNPYLGWRRNPLN